MQVPAGRGPLSEHVARCLRTHPDRGAFAAVVVPDDLDEHEVLGDDVQLALWMLYEQSYRGFEDAFSHEWEPDAVRVRRRLEAAFETVLREATAPFTARGAAPGQARTDDVVARLEAVIAEVDVPSVAGYLQRHATREQVLDFLSVRSLYHLKESDPHAFVVGRLDGPAKVALAELQYDEFGAGRPEALHSLLYGRALQAAGLDHRYGAYLEVTPASALAVNNVMSLFGLQHRLRGAALGHLAAFEATSSVPCRRIAAGIERVGLPPVTAHYFHEHVEADSVHEHVALRGICGAYVEQHPGEADEVVFGAAACLVLDARAGAAQLASWQGGRDEQDGRPGSSPQELVS